MPRLSSIKNMIKFNIVQSTLALAKAKFESADISGLSGPIDTVDKYGGGTLMGLQTVSTTNIYSISVWVNPASGQVLYIMYESELNNIKCSFDGTYVYVYYSAGNGTDMNVSMPHNSNTWIHLVFVYNVTDFYFYMNGTLQVTKLDFITIPSTAASTVNFTKCPEEWVNYVKDCRLFDYALSVTEVSDIYNSSELSSISSVS